MRQAGNRPGTRNAARQEARGALGSRPEVQLRSVRYSGNIPYFEDIGEEDDEPLDTEDTAGVLRGDTPDIPSVPTSTPSEQLRQDI